MGIFVCTLIVGAASLAMAGIPDLEESTAAAATGGTLSLFNLPNAGGDDFTNAYIYDGVGGVPTIVNGTVTLNLRDGGGAAIANFPAEDMIIMPVDVSTMIICAGGTIADADTDEFGVTEWQNPMNVGGYHMGLIQVLISGDALTSAAGIPFYMNSADIDFNGTVNLQDVGLFAADFLIFANTGVAAYKSDFVSDDALNVADVGKLAVGVGASCP